MKILGGFLQSLGTRGFGLLAAMIGSVVTARALGPEGKGVIALLGTVTATLVQFGSLGLTAANVNFIAREPAIAARLVGVSTWVAAGMGGGLGILALVGTAWRPELLPGVDRLLLLLAVFSVPFLLGSHLLQYVLLGTETVRVYNAIELLRAGLGLAALLSLLTTRMLTVTSLVFMTSALAVLVCIVTLFAVKGRAPISWRCDVGVLREALQYSLIFFVNNFVAYLLIRSDVFLVNHFLGVGAVGIYSVAVQVCDLLLLAPAILGTLLFPRLSSILDPAERARACLQFARLTAAGMAIMCIVTGLVTPVFIPLVFGTRFQPAWMPLVILLPGVWILALETVLITHLAARRLSILVPMLWLAALVLNIGLNVALLPRLGIGAAAATSTLAYAVVALGVLGMFCSETGCGLAEVVVPRRADWTKVFRRLREGGMAA